MEPLDLAFAEVRIKKNRASQRTSLTRPVQNANKVEGYRATGNTHLIVFPNDETSACAPIQRIGNREERK